MTLRRRLSWLVIATTSTVVVSFVIPLCLLVRNLAEERAVSTTDQEARNIAIAVASSRGRYRQLERNFPSLDALGVPASGVLWSDGRTLGDAADMAEDPAVVELLTTPGAESRRVDNDAGTSVYGAPGSCCKSPMGITDGARYPSGGETCSA